MGAANLGISTCRAVPAHAFLSGLTPPHALVHALVETLARGSDLHLSTGLLQDLSLHMPVPPRRALLHLQAIIAANEAMAAGADPYGHHHHQHQQAAAEAAEQQQVAPAGRSYTPIPFARR